MSRESDPKAQIKAQARQQAYWARRRLVQRLDREGTSLAVSRMSGPALTAQLHRSLVDVVGRLAGQSDVEAFAAAQAALACYDELMMRGEQLCLFGE